MKELKQHAFEAILEGCASAFDLGGTVVFHRVYRRPKSGEFEALRSDCHRVGGDLKKVTAGHHQVSAVRKTRELAEAK